MKQSIVWITIFSVAALGIAACTKEPAKNLSAEESRIYITNGDSTVQFSSFHTFSIADSVAVIDNNKLSGRDRTNVDLAFIQAVREQMQLRGFTEVDKGQSPDLGINVSRIYNTYTGILTYPDYWGGYNNYYDPYYWGYGGSSYYFPPYYDYYQVTEGALSIDLLNLKQAAPTNKIEGVWQGLIRGSGIFTQPAAAQVKALFDQSVYLSSNQ